MALKAFFLLLVIAAIAFGRPQIDFADDPGFANGQGQGGFPTLDNGGEGVEATTLPQEDVYYNLQKR